MKRLRWDMPQVLINLLIVWALLLAGLKRQQVLPPISLFDEINILLIGMILLFILMLFSSNSFNLEQMAFLYVGSIYIGFGFSFMLELMWSENGTFFSLLIILVIWATDTGAYFVGKHLGKHKLWPAISPNKTIEGSLGGIGLALIISVLFAIAVPQFLPLFTILAFGFTISVIGQIGDLVESAWKRTSGVKDSGTLLPGHGGILDRFDSLLFSFIILHFLQQI